MHFAAHASLLLPLAKKANDIYKNGGKTVSRPAAIPKSTPPVSD
ncbi:MAG: hypothetical protein DVB22_002615 [Verrucomicrobia bacterium]|nr:MAG: hypothetical protein DVB22_002615 [Verrucomicrobiota bacterium]